jgi:hypothetical protein
MKLYLPVCSYCVFSKYSKYLLSVLIGNNMFKIWDSLCSLSHGVNNLPYRGRRTHFSNIRQILGSSTERHNDLFGLAIFQFERKYKAYLECREHNESQIFFALSKVFWGMFCRSVPWYVFFWLLYCLSLFKLHHMIVPLASS